MVRASNALIKKQFDPRRTTTTTKKDGDASNIAFFLAFFQTYKTYYTQNITYSKGCKDNFAR
jgi:hypothetical protein